jgi:hypothetical protein
MPTSTAILIEPERAPSSAADQRPYLIADRANVAVKAATISVIATSARQLTASLARRRKVFIKSIAGNQTVYLGGSGVSTSNGYPLHAKEDFWIDLNPGAVIWAIRASGGSDADVRVLEAGV